MSNEKKFFEHFPLDSREVRKAVVKPHLETLHEVVAMTETVYEVLARMQVATRPTTPPGGRSAPRPEHQPHALHAHPCHGGQPHHHAPPPLLLLARAGPHPPRHLCQADPEQRGGHQGGTCPCSMLARFCGSSCSSTRRPTPWTSSRCRPPLHSPQEKLAPYREMVSRGVVSATKVLARNRLQVQTQLLSMFQTQAGLTTPDQVSPVVTPSLDHLMLPLVRCSH